MGCLKLTYRSGSSHLKVVKGKSNISVKSYAGVYGYGFNQMEKDDEFKGAGNSYDFGARIYDPRLGRFLSLDPLMAAYPFMSPYCFAANNPIRYIDEYGMGPKDAIKMLNQYVSSVNISLNNTFSKSESGRNLAGGTGEEWFGIGVIKKTNAGDLSKLTLKNVATIHQYSGTKINYSVDSDEQAIFDFHTHHGKYPGVDEQFMGLAFSGRDIFRVSEAMTNLGVGNDWASIIDSGTKRFALVIVDEEKAKKFFEGKDENDLNNAYQTAYDAAYKNNGEDHAAATKTATQMIIGDGSESGIQFFETTDKEKQNFEQVL